MKRNEVEFVDALRKIGFSNSICESINDIRKAIFEGEDGSDNSDLSKDESTKFNRVGEFHDGYARVEDRGVYNFVDESGTILFRGGWLDKAFDFSDGYAAVAQKYNGRINWNWLGKNGKLLFPYKNFDWAGNFEGGYAQAKLDGKDKWVDKEGNIYDSDPR